MKLDGGKNPRRGNAGSPRANKLYGDRVAAKRDALAGVKGPKVPLGGAPPIPPGKLAALAEPQLQFPDELPPDMVNRGAQGVGDAYQANQVTTQGLAGGPMSMAEAKAMGLGMVQEPQAEEPDPPDDDEPEDETPVGDKLDQAEKDTVEGFRDALPFNFENISAVQLKLLDRKRKEFIESQLEDLDLADLITKGYIEQEVVIIPGKLRITLRTFSQKEHLWMLENLYNYPGTTGFVKEVLDTFKLVAAVVAVNGRRLPTHLNDKGGIEKSKFDNKMDIVSKWPVQLIADVSVQCTWFNDRVLELFTHESLKNG